MPDLCWEPHCWGYKGKPRLLKDKKVYITFFCLWITEYLHNAHTEIHTVKRWMFLMYSVLDIFISMPPRLKIGGILFLSCLLFRHSFILSFCHHLKTLTLLITFEQWELEIWPWGFSVCRYQQFSIMWPWPWSLTNSNIFNI